MSQFAVNMVMVKEEKSKNKLIYYVSKVLKGAETRYSIIEKFAYAVVIVAKKMKPYFQAHQVIILTNQPLKWIFHKLKIVGQMM